MAREVPAARPVRLARLGSGLPSQARTHAQMSLFVDTSVWSLALRRDDDSLSTVLKHITDRNRRGSSFEPRFEPGDIRLSIDACPHIRGHR